MSWENQRGSEMLTASRRTAHSDDAKDRHDESTEVRPPGAPRMTRNVVAGVASLVLVAAGVAGVAALKLGDDASSADAPRVGAVGPGADPDTGANASEGGGVGRLPDGGLKFDAAGAVDYVIASSTGQKRTTESVSFHADCDDQACTFSKISGFLPRGVGDRPLLRTGDATWAVEERPARLDCGGAQGEPGLAGAVLMVGAHDIRLAIHRGLVERRTSGCFRIFTSIDGTLVSPRT